MEVVAANDLGSVDQMAPLLQYASVFGRFPGEVRVVDGGIAIEDRLIRFLAKQEPKSLPWADLGVDVVIEATGRFRDRGAAGTPSRPGRAPTDRRRRRPRSGFAGRPGRRPGRGRGGRRRPSPRTPAARESPGQLAEIGALPAYAPDVGAR